MARAGTQYTTSQRSTLEKLWSRLWFQIYFPTALQTTQRTFRTLPKRTHNTLLALQLPSHSLVPPQDQSKLFHDSSISRLPAMPATTQTVQNATTTAHTAETMTATNLGPRHSRDQFKPTVTTLSAIDTYYAPRTTSAHISTLPLD